MEGARQEGIGESPFLTEIFMGRTPGSALEPWPGYKNGRPTRTAADLGVRPTS